MNVVMVSPFFATCHFELSISLDGCLSRWLQKIKCIYLYEDNFAFLIEKEGIKLLQRHLRFWIQRK